MIPEKSLRPTNVRSIIILVAMLAAVLLYLERVCLGVAQEYIRQDLNLGSDQIANVMAAFFFSYALGQVPAGWLAQRYGPRFTMSLFLFSLAVFSIFIAYAQTYEMLLLARFLLGASQAGAYPTAAILVKRWVPDRSRGLASGIVTFGGRFGGACANWLTGVLIVIFVPSTAPSELTPRDILNVSIIAQPNESQLKSEAKTPEFQGLRTEIRKGLPMGDHSRESLCDGLNHWITDPHDLVDWSKLKLAMDGRSILGKPVEQRTTQEMQRLNRFALEQAFPDGIRQLHELGWRPTLLVYGLAALVIAGLFLLIARDWPRMHPWCNPAEVELIESGQIQAKVDSHKAGIPLKPLIMSRNQWLCSGFHLFNNLGWVFLITYLPQFLAERFQVPVDTRGLMSTIPLFVASFAMLAGGVLTDRLTGRYGRRLGRMIPMSLLKIPCVFALLTCPYLDSAWNVIIALSILAICTDLGMPAAWAFAQDTGGTQSATVLGWVNMWGNLGAWVGAKWLLEIRTQHGWDVMLTTCAGAFALSGILALFTRADVPLESPVANPR